MITAKGLDWLSESVSQSSMLKKAERNLDQFLDAHPNSHKDALRVKADITKFVASRAGKEKWSEKQEIETKSLNLNVNLSSNPQAEEIAKKYEDEMRKALIG